LIVVSDSSPLIALARIGHLSLLREMYGQVAVPQAVYGEVVNGQGGRPGAAEVARADWIVVRKVRNAAVVSALRADLGAGESEAIALALEFPDPLLLVDERLARRAAVRLGLDPVGTIGVLVEAKRKGLVPAIRPLLDDLVRIAGFWISQRLYDTLIEAEREPPTSD
jgi:predicted nucleic acid-binding protein